jgi:hypothetical protein
MELYTTYGWPAVTRIYDLFFYNTVTRTSHAIDPDEITGSPRPVRENRYTMGTCSDDVGLLYVYPVNESGKRLSPYTFPINNPASLSTLRWFIRAGLNDVETADAVDVQYPASPRWPDAEINMHIRDAIGLLNDYIPRDVTIELPYVEMTPDQARAFTQINDVSYYDMMFQTWRVLDRVIVRNAQNFRRYQKAEKTKYWELDDSGWIILHGMYPPETLLRVSGSGIYTKPLRDDEPIQVDPNDWDMITLYAQGRCYMRLAGQAAQLDRWKEDGKRNDNPILPIGRDFLKQAEQRMWDRRGPRAVRRFRG